MPISQRMSCAWKISCGGCSGSPGIALWKPKSTASTSGWSVGSTGGDTTSGMRHSNLWTPKTNRFEGWPNGWCELLILLPRWSTPGESLSETEKDEVLADSLQTQFKPVTDLSVPAVIDIFNVALRSYFLTPASETNWTNPDEVEEAIWGIYVRNVSGPNGISNMALKYLPQRAELLLAQIFNSVLLLHHFPKFGSTFEWSLSLNRGRIRHCPHPIGPIESCTRLVKYFKTSY